MIKASELRIGNLVYWNEPKKVGVPHRVIRIMENRINTVPISLGNSMEDYSPIPLSEGLLVAAGFTMYEKGYKNNEVWLSPKENKWYTEDNTQMLNYEGNMYGVGRYGDWWVILDKNGDFKNDPNTCFYLHQFQNLWMAVYGEELSFDLSLVVAGLNQPPAAEAMRGADSTATQDVERATDLYSDEPAMTASGGDYRAMPLGEFTDLPIDGEGFTVVSSDSAITSESREADGGKLPIDSESGKEVSWQETARNFMEESGRLKAENEKLRELLRLKERFSSLNRRYYDLTLTKEEETEIEKVYARISELRSELGLDK